MKVLFRADASYVIGTGHIMRCLTIAYALEKHGVECCFICREKPGNLIDFIRSKGFQVHVLANAIGAKDDNGTAHRHFLECTQEEDARDCLKKLDCCMFDWIVVDHYGLDRYWENRLRQICRNVMVIDDLADRLHSCDILLDQTLGRTAREYSNLTPKGCKHLCGAEFALLRPEFSQFRENKVHTRKAQIQELMVSMGGVDNDNVTGLVLRSLSGSAIPSTCHITVVMGKNSPWIDEVKGQAEQMPWKTTVAVGVDNMAELMSNSDFAIGAAGSTAWERCCLGLPTIMVVIAQNQQAIATALERKGAAIKMSLKELSSCEGLINATLVDASFLEKMSHSALSVTDGRGVNHVTKFLVGMGGYNEDNSALQ